MNLDGDITSLFTKPKLAPGETLPQDTTAPGETAGGTPQDTSADHPLMRYADLAIHIAVPICQHNGIEPPAQDFYDSFTRDTINQAAWEFAPDIGVEGGELPRWIIAVLAIVGIALVFLPTAMSLIQKQKEKEEAEKIESAENETLAQPEQPAPQEPAGQPPADYQPPEDSGTAIIGL